MKKDKLKELTIEELQKKQKGIKTLIGLFIPIILALSYFVFQDYSNGKSLTFSIGTLICAFGGLVALFPELNRIKTEISERA